MRGEVADARYFGRATHVCVRGVGAAERWQASEAVGWVLLFRWVRGGAAALLVDGACRSNPLTTVAGQIATSAVILAK